MIDEWPSLLRCFLTWAFALKEARNQAINYEQRTYVRRAWVEGRWVWVVAFDPKKNR